MTRLVARNASTDTVLAEHVGVAATRLARATGLLTRSSLPAGEALLIAPSRGVHTWGMRFAIDVIALDHGGKVIDCVSRMAPWRVRLPRRGTAGVLELPAGTLEASRTTEGHRVVLEVVSQDLPAVVRRSA